MKKTLALLVLMSFALLGCRNPRQCNEIVKETYIHKYGVPVTKSDWDSQGKDGQSVVLRKDGVTVTTPYQKGIIHGALAYTFPNSSTIQHVDIYNQGTLVAKREHYPSGVPAREELLEEQGLVKLTSWYEDGTPQLEEIYQDTLLVSGEYRTPLNVIEARVHDGKGERVCRSGEGDLLSRDTIRRGEMKNRVSYFANGDPKAETPFVHGVIHGTRLTYLPGGLPSTVEEWVQGVQEGNTSIYQNGEKIAQIPYVNGKRNGIECRYRDGTELAEEITWKDDRRHGTRKLYVDGETKTEWYHEG